MYCNNKFSVKHWTVMFRKLSEPHGNPGYRSPDYRGLTILRIHTTVCHQRDGFGGLVVSMLASGTQVCGFKAGRSR